MQPPHVCRTHLKPAHARVCNAGSFRRSWGLGMELTSGKPLAGRKVLVLEDELIIAFALEDMLADMGAEVVMAGTIEEARDRLAETAVSLAVLDVNLKGTKSYALADELAGRGVPLIFATGYGDSEHPPHLVGAATLTKPYNRTQLAEAIAAVG